MFLSVSSFDFLLMNELNEGVCETVTPLHQLLYCPSYLQEFLSLLAPMEPPQIRCLLFVC